MDLSIRQETTSDYPAVFALIKSAFEKEVHSDHREQFLVERLRSSPAFIPALSLVAESHGKIVGHILLTSIWIKNGDKAFPSLALAPVSVLPNKQGNGIGAKLIREAHERATCLGHQSVVLLGHAGYYPRFGYERADKYGIRLPFPAPPENCLVTALTPAGLAGVTGTVEYPQAFFE
ncbi:MAG: N-acetyltransferase [Bacteroidota bacterium]